MSDAFPVVAVLEKRGRFFTATPFFARGRRINLDKPAARDARRRPGARAPDRPARRSRQGRQAAGEAGHRARRARGADARPRAAAALRPRRRAVGARGAPSTRRTATRARAATSRALPTFTIDPPTARDFDDAISAERLEDGAIRVWVHIADVSAHVPPGSLVDREARRRGTSVYVPGKVEPMLPEALSNVACSLVPGQDRLAVTVELEFEGATLRRSAFTRSTIRSDARLDYPRVDRIFAGEEQAEAPWAEPLYAAREAAAALEAARQARGALAVETVEPEFDFSHEGHVTGLAGSETTESHRLIEHLMIAANEAVATLLDTGKVPALYRIHERPEPLRVKRLVEQLASLDVPTPPLPETMSPQQAEDAVGEISRMVDAHVRRTGRGRAALTSLVLRSLKQARYDPVNRGHAGLRSPRYCHFTSPIRRYPDLVCHRALLSAVGGGEDAHAASSLEELADWCSKRERDAMSIERAADDIARCFLLESELFKRGWQAEWPGEVIGVIGAGAFVAFGDGYEGMLPVRRLRGDWWELNEEETMLVGSQSGMALRLGDPVVVQVERVDAPRGRVDLSPVTLGASDG